MILATGVNSRAPLDPAWGYRLPHTEIVAQDDAPLPGGFFDGHVHIFFDYPPGSIFAGLIPKGGCAHISLPSRGCLPWLPVALPVNVQSKGMLLVTIARASGHIHLGHQL